MRSNMDAGGQTPPLRLLSARPTPWWQRHDGSIGWIVLIALVLVMLAIELAGNRKSVTRAYATAGHAWLHGGDLYNGRGHGFLYLPITGVLFVPMAATPGVGVEIAWRLFTLGTLAVTLRMAASLVQRRTGVPCFAAMSGMAAVLGFPAVRNGQATLPMAAALLLSIVAAVERRHRLAAITATVALFMKPLALPVVAVLAVCRPRMIPPLLAGVLLLLVAPYALATPTWVNRQYMGFVEVLTLSQRMQDGAGWATFFGMLHAFGFPASGSIRLPVQLAAALAVALGCRAALRRLDPAAAAIHVYALTMTLMLLLSPRSENNTYVCIVPAVASVMASAVAAGRPHWPAIVACWTAVIMMTSSYELGRVLAPRTAAVWLAPLTTTLLTPWFVWQFLRDLQAASATEAGEVIETVRLPSAWPDAGAASKRAA